MEESKEQSKSEGHEIVIYSSGDEILICALSDEEQLKGQWFRGSDKYSDRFLEEYTRDVAKFGPGDVVHIRIPPCVLNHGVRKIINSV
jgi:hypothetical protein